jgi:tripartite-type tricarboxylate transporter receptor subunit TctC
MALALSLGGVASAADNYPSKSVKIVVSFDPGSGTDLSARVIAKKLAEQLGVAVVVENRPGAGGVIGNDFVAKSAPDGYTLLMAEPGFTIGPSLKKLPHDPLKDFTPITGIMRNASILIINNNVKANTVQELIDLAKAHPKMLNYGSAGIGSNSHMNAELFKMITKTDITHIPYSGAAQVTGIASDAVQMIITGVPTALAAINTGKVKALAVTTDGKRLPGLSDVPSFKEAGVPGMELYTWYGLVGPAHLPPEIVNKLQSEVAKALADPAIQKALVGKTGGEVLGNSPKQFGDYLAAEVKRWAEVVKTAGIKVQ